MSVELERNAGWKSRIYFTAINVIILIMVYAGTGYGHTQEEPSIADLMLVVNGPENAVNSWERWAAVMAIGRKGSLEAAQTIVPLLDSPSIVFSAAAAITQITDKKALPLLVSKLSHEKEWVRISLCETIGQIGGDEAVAALVGVAKNDGRKFVRQTAVHSLGDELSANPKGAVIPALLDILKIPVLTEDAMAALQKLRDKSAVKGLHPGLAFEDAQVRMLVCDVIRSCRASDSTDQLLSLLKTERDKGVISKAILALSVVHPPDRMKEVSAVLAGFLNDEENAPSALQAIDRSLESSDGLDAKTATTLGKALLPTLSSKNNSIRHGGANAFKRLRYTKASPKLIGLIKKEEEQHIRNSALIALGHCLENEKEVRFLLDWGTEHSQDTQAVCQAIDRIRLPVSAKPFIDEIQKEKSRFIPNALDAIGRIKDPSTAKPLLQFIENGGRIAISAAQALATVAGPDDLSQIAQLLFEERGQRNIELINCFVALDRLNGFGRTKALLKSGGEKENKALSAIFYQWKVVPADDEILIEALSVKDTEVKRAVAYPLSRIDSVKGRAALCRVLQNDSERSVREEAGKALGAFADTKTVQCLVDAYAVELADDSAILVDEAIQRALSSATGQRFYDAKQYRAWYEKNFGANDKIGLRIQLLRHEDEKIRLLASRDIAQWPDRDEMRQALVPIMELMEKDGNGYAEELIWMQTLGRIGAPCAIRILGKQLQQRNNIREVTIIAKALAELKNDQGIEYLINQLRLEGKSRDQYQELIEALSVATGRPLIYDADSWVKWWDQRKKVVLSSTP
jgi:HEAT repeat protein